MYTITPATAMEIMFRGYQDQVSQNHRVINVMSMVGIEPDTAIIKLCRNIFMDMAAMCSL